MQRSQLTIIAKFFLLICTASLLACMTVETQKQTTKDIYRALKQQDLGPYDVSIEMTDSRVKLSGYVASEKARDIIEEVVLNNPNITSVKNKLKIGESSKTLVPSSELKKKIDTILMAIKQDPKIHGFNIKAASSASKIKLTGTVNDFDDYLRLQEIINEHSQPGDVVNFVSLRELLSDEQMSNLARTQLERNNNGDIKAFVFNAVLTLRGDRQSFEQVDAILTSVINIPDVRTVKNEITVNGQAYPRDRFNLAQ